MQGKMESTCIPFQQSNTLTAKMVQAGPVQPQSGHWLLCGPVVTAAPGTGQQLSEQYHTGTRAPTDARCSAGRKCHLPQGLWHLVGLALQWSEPNHCSARPIASMLCSKLCETVADVWQAGQLMTTTSNETKVSVCCCWHTRQSSHLALWPALAQVLWCSLAVWKQSALWAAVLGSCCADGQIEPQALGRLVCLSVMQGNIA